MHRTDPAAARAMAAEFVGFLRKHMRPDGITEAWEWMNPDTDKRNNPLYAASVVLPYVSLKQAGLIADTPRRGSR